MVSQDISKAANLHTNLMAEVSKVVIGKKEIKEALFLALMAGGHILIEGTPGTAKTTASKSFAGAIGGTFQRIQFTPDMMPADITGFFLHSLDGKSNFIQGPIFANMVLADELNRTTPRTQSALLEAMQEHQVTVDRNTFKLPLPFMVIATQVQSGGEGTYSLTDVQIDRFLLHIWSQYPTREEEKEVISNIDRIDAPNIHTITNLEEIREIQGLIKNVQVSPALTEYIISIIQGLRTDPDIVSGPSTRGAIALYKCSRAQALFAGRDYVIPDDIKGLVFSAVEHRIRVKPEAEMEGVTPRTVLARILERTAVPKIA